MRRVAVFRRVAGRTAFEGYLDQPSPVTTGGFGASDLPLAAPGVSRDEGTRVRRPLGGPRHRHVCRVRKRR